MFCFVLLFFCFIYGIFFRVKSKNDDALLEKERAKLYESLDASFKDKLYAYRKKWLREAKAEDLLEHLESHGVGAIHEAGEAVTGGVDEASLVPRPLCIDEAYIKLLEVQHDDVKTMLQAEFACILAKKDKDLASKNDELMGLRSRYQHVMKEINSNLFESNTRSLIDLKAQVARKFWDMAKSHYQYLEDINIEHVIADFVRAEGHEAEQKNLSLASSDAAEVKEDLTFLATPDVSGAEALDISEAEVPSVSAVLVDVSVGSNDVLANFEVGGSKDEKVNVVMEQTAVALKPVSTSSKVTSVLNRFVPLKRVPAKTDLCRHGNVSEEKAPLIDLVESDESE